MRVCVCISFLLLHNDHSQYLILKSHKYGIGWEWIGLLCAKCRYQHAEYYVLSYDLKSMRKKSTSTQLSFTDRNRNKCLFASDRTLTCHKNSH